MLIHKEWGYVAVKENGDGNGDSASEHVKNEGIPNGVPFRLQFPIAFVFENEKAKCLSVVVGIIILICKNFFILKYAPPHRVFFMLN